MGQFISAIRFERQSDAVSSRSLAKQPRNETERLGWLLSIFDSWRITIQKNVAFYTRLAASPFRVLLLAQTQTITVDFPIIFLGDIFRLRQSRDARDGRRRASNASKSDVDKINPLIDRLNRTAKSPAILFNASQLFTDYCILIIN